MTIRILDISDLSHCIALAEDRDWPPEDHKWRLLFRAGDVYGIDDPTGRGLAGVVVCTRYGRELAAVGMMLVAESHGRQGLGTRLMRHVIANAGVATIWLTATSYGRPLYEKVGFRAIDECTQYTGDFTGTEPRMRSRPVTDADLPAILALDAKVFGAPRPDLLRHLPEFTDGFRVIDAPNGLIGFGAAWRNTDNTVLGPVVADDKDTARALLSDLAASTTGPVRLDLVRSRPDQLAWAAEHGLRPGSSTTVMIHGDDLPGDRDRLFNPLMVAMG